MAWQSMEQLESVPGLPGLSLHSWRHSVHGTDAIIAQVGGPLCTAAMVFATQGCDDKGLAHCLEHMCFMGSRDFQKGYLDFLAKRCGCDGTNAYTETDHTCFELTAAGEMGLLVVLPVFVRHVLCPALTEDAFITEIHHINGQGERQGVVFSEMLGRVTDQEEMLDLELRRAAFGETSPYSYECGGMPDEILKLTSKDIFDYHNCVYTTDNLHVVLTGTFDEAKVLHALAGALDAAVMQGAQQRCTSRPFVIALPQLPTSCPRRRCIAFPSDDVSVGMIAYSHRLQGVEFNDVTTVAALKVLGRYLTDLASSPLEQALVQREPPAASSVTCDVALTAEPYLTIHLAGVPFCASSDEVKAAMKLGGSEGDDEDEESEDAADNVEGSEEEEEQDGPSGANQGGNEDGLNWFDADIMLQHLIDELHKVHEMLKAGDEKAYTEVKRAIKKEKIEWQVEFEDEPNEFVRDQLLPHLIFGHYPSAKSGEGDKAGVLLSLPSWAEELESLSSRPAWWWAEILQQHLLGPLTATCHGEKGGAAEVKSCPSALLCLRNERNEERVAKSNAKKLGKKKLKALQDRVDSAERANSASLSEQQQDSFPTAVMPDCVPDICWVMNLIPPTEGGLEVLDVEVSSCFVELHVMWLIDDAALSGHRGAELCGYLRLFASLVCETDVGGDDYRTIVKRLDDELVSYSASVECGSPVLQNLRHPCQLVLRMSALPENSDNIVNWADRLAHECEFSEHRVLAQCRRLISDYKERMREADSVVSEVMTTVVHGPLSPQLRLGAFAQRSFIERCCERLEDTCQALRQLRDIIVSPSTRAVAVVSGSCQETRHVIRNKLEARWRLRHASTRASLLDAVRWVACDRPTSQSLLPFRYVVVGCASSDTANVRLRAELLSPAVVMDGERCWALRLVCEALSMMEGPLCLAIRGKGLAYGASIDFAEADNSVTLDLWECTNVRKAIEAALAVITEAADEIDQFQLDNARGSLVFSLKSQRATPASTTEAAKAAGVRGWRSKAEVQGWEQLLQSVTQKHVADAHTECVMRLSDASKVVACIACNPSDCKKSAKGLAAVLGLNMSDVFIKETLSDCYELVDARVQTVLSTVST